MLSVILALKWFPKVLISRLHKLVSEAEEVLTTKSNRECQASDLYQFGMCAWTRLV